MQHFFQEAFFLGGIFSGFSKKNNINRNTHEIISQNDIQ